MDLVLLVVNKKTQHMKAAGGRCNWLNTHPCGDPRTYNISFPIVGGPSNSPVRVCRGREAMRAAMLVHFLHCYVRDTVIILD